MSARLPAFIGAVYQKFIDPSVSQPNLIEMMSLVVAIPLTVLSHLVFERSPFGLFGGRIESYCEPRDLWIEFVEISPHGVQLMLEERQRRP